ncbi:MAG: 50S ribosomal protein L31 [bacterium]|nr:50S ribosomal protein L31 [bacterium]
MKKDIHPPYYPKAKVTCTCGKTHTMGATKPEIAIEVCSNCHPFYTGKENLLDIGGRIERFKARRAGVKPQAPRKTRVAKNKKR